MKKLEVLFVAVMGAAGAIPGIAAIKKFEVPMGYEPYFDFALVIASTATVLLVFSMRGHIVRLRDRWIIATAFGGGAVVVTIFLVLVWVSSHVFVAHDWDGVEERQFFPLFLADNVAEMISEDGSRRQFIMDDGPATVSDFTTEGNTAATLIVLLLLYTALVAALATFFTALGVHLMSKEDGDAVVEPAVLEAPP